jgi:hypothetical protein
MLAHHLCLVILVLIVKTIVVVIVVVVVVVVNVPSLATIFCNTLSGLDDEDDAACNRVLIISIGNIQVVPITPAIAPTPSLTGSGNFFGFCDFGLLSICFCILYINTRRPATTIQIPRYYYY